VCCRAAPPGAQPRARCAQKNGERRTIARMAASRLLSQQTIQSFADISRFLREGVADEESRQLRDSVGALAQAIDEALRARRAQPDPVRITRLALALVRAVREHQLVLTGLGSAWHSLYEFGAYQSALRELRRASEAWHKALERRSSREGAAFDHVELLAWRTLGEAMLLIDMYEQGGQSDSDTQPLSGPPPAPSPWDRAKAWWLHLRR